MYHYIQLNIYKHKKIGKYGRMRKEYLQEKNPMLLNDLIFREQPFPHLLAIYETTHCRVES
ncbi:TnpV protein [Dialister invisus]|uniref:TnpV protein n=1 Tax=Dialister invisus TaxID=218538 RepID=UPI00349F506F